MTTTKACTIPPPDPKPSSTTPPAPKNRLRELRKGRPDRRGIQAVEGREKLRQRRLNQLKP